MKVVKKMSVRFAVRVELVLVLLPFILLSIFPCAAAVSGILCRKAEREALLDFKLSFTADPNGILSSWSVDNPDCCTQWDGVGCDSDTGHVVFLSVADDLESHRLRPSLLVLQHLTTLVLSWNNFTMRIPEFIGSLTNLEDLNLSESGFYGKIPPHLGNLTHLHTLMVDGRSPGLLYSDNLQWLSHLSSLHYVDLSGVNLSTAIDWISSLKRLPSISMFACSSCSFPLTPQPVSSTCPHNHSTSLQGLDLSSSQISFPDFLYLINGTTSLTSLALASMEQSHDDFFRPLFQSATKSMLFPVLYFLDISGNQLIEFMPAPQNSSAMPNLGRLDISNNLMTKVPDLSTFSPTIMWKGIWANESAKMLPQLNVIDLSNNCLTGKIPSGFTSLKYLKSLDLSSNNLTGSIPDKIGELKYMEVLELSSNKLSGEIPQSLADLTLLDTLNLSSNNLSGEIPKSTQLQSFDPSSYGENAELCGDPLPTLCPWDNGILEPPRSVRDHAEEEEGHGSFDFEAFYAALGAGFASGLFGILGIIHFHAPSRHAFFHKASEVGDRIFVWTMLYKSRIKRRLCFSKENDAARI